MEKKKKTSKTGLKPKASKKTRVRKLENPKKLIQSRDGSERMPLTDDGGPVAIDITGLKMAEALVAEELRDTRILHRLSTLTVNDDSIRNLYDEILKAAIELTRADAGTLQIYDEKTQTLVLLAAQGFDAGMTAHLQSVEAYSNTSSGIALRSCARAFIDHEKNKKDGSNKLYLAAGLLSAQSTPLVARSGKTVGMFTTHWRTQRRANERELPFLDILARQAADLIDHGQTSRALRESEQKRRIAIDASRLGTWEWDLKTDKIFWNEKHFTLLGLRPRKNPVDLQTFIRRVHPDHRGRLQKELERAIETKSIFDSEFCIFRPDGATRWMSGYGQVKESGADHEVTKMSGVMFDITERKQAEDSLRKSEEHLNLILESTKDYAIITFDLKGRITRWNAGAERIFGYTEQEARGASTHLIFTPEDVANHVPEKELASALKNGRAEDERWHLRKDGTRFFASGVMQLLHDSKTEGFVKICRDETARLEAEQSAVEREMLRLLVAAQEDERRRIARDIHDHFGQQLTALRLMLDSIKTAVEGNQEVTAHIEDAQQAAAALDANVDFIAWELRPAALDDLGLRAALANFVAEWSKHTGINAEFHASGLSRTRLVYEIETNLYRIAQEALNNVLKHSAATHVSVLLEKSRDKISLIVEDDGVGFNQRDKAKRKKGIGLVGMIERAKICGGDLEIESAKGSGTTVFVRVPVKKEG